MTHPFEPLVQIVEIGKPFRRSHSPLGEGQQGTGSNGSSSCLGGPWVARCQPIIVSGDHQFSGRPMAASSHCYQLQISRINGGQYQGGVFIFGQCASRGLVQIR